MWTRFEGCRHATEIVEGSRRKGKGKGKGGDGIKGQM